MTILNAGLITIINIKLGAAVVWLTLIDSVMFPILAASKQNNMGHC